MPEEIVFEDTEEDYPVTKEIIYQGILLSVLVQPTEEGVGFVVQRVYSSNPAVYLREELQPGSVLRLNLP